MENAVELFHVYKNYHEPDSETQAIKDISFSIGDGEFAAIVGPSGCGKSTLLSIISGLIPVSGGEVLMHGKQLGYMLQMDHLFEWRTIFQNACLGLEIQNKKTPENIEFVEMLLDQYGLKDFKRHKPSQLSGGMRQRVALIRTLAVKPDILLLDEPFSSLDYQTRLYVADEISSIIRQEKKTAVLVTHDISEAVAIADRVIVLTRRPSRVAAIHTIDLESPRRDSPRFREFFNLIWKELDMDDLT